MDSGNRTPPHSTKVFLHRDYIDGTGIKFQNKFPPELEGKVCFNFMEWDRMGGEVTILHKLLLMQSVKQQFTLVMCTLLVF